MSYIGNTPVNQNFVAGSDQFNGTGSQTVFTLSRNVNTVNDIQVVVSNVPQDPFTAYSVAGNSLTFTSAPPAGTGNVYVVYRATNVQTFVPTPGVSPSFGNLAYTGTLTGGTGVVNLGSGQVYKDASGNVGIGTSSPSFKLDVAGNARVGNVYGTGLTVTVAGNSITYPTDNTLAFNTASTERARIDSSGNLLVGTTSNSGNARIAVSGTGSGGAYLMRLASSATGAATADGLEFVFGDGVVKGSIRWNSTVTAYNTSSDYRLKENIQPMTDALAKVAALKPCTYTWKVDGSDGQGFIAHELAEVEPGCVTGEKDAVDAEGNPQYQGIDTSFLVATLTAAIQEQQQMIETLQAKVAALEAK